MSDIPKASTELQVAIDHIKSAQTRLQRSLPATNFKKIEGNLTYSTKYIELIRDEVERHAR